MEKIWNNKLQLITIMKQNKNWKGKHSNKHTPQYELEQKTTNKDYSPQSHLDTIW